jgi:hypothetical protein
MDEKKELDTVISELKSHGIGYNTHQQIANQGTEEQLVGLGDVVESVLNKLGITQERYKAFWGIDECNCTERKKYLNNLLSWHVKRKEGQG